MNKYDFMTRRNIFEKKINLKFWTLKSSRMGDCA